MNKQRNCNILPITEVLLAFYKIGLALKYEKKPPNQQRGAKDG